jgi:hypothetical protein
VLLVVRLRPTQAGSSLHRLRELTATRYEVVGARILWAGDDDQAGHPAEQAGEHEAAGAEDPGKGIEPFSVHGVCLQGDGVLLSRVLSK